MVTVVKRPHAGAESILGGEVVTSGAVHADEVAGGEGGDSVDEAETVRVVRSARASVW